MKNLISVVLIIGADSVSDLGLEAELGWEWVGAGPRERGRRGSGKRQGEGGVWGEGAECGWGLRVDWGWSTPPERRKLAPVILISAWGS